jgi:hypothetical protein
VADSHNAAVRQIDLNSGALVESAAWGGRRTAARTAASLAAGLAVGAALLLRRT